MKKYIVVLVIILCANHVSVRLFAHVSNEKTNVQTTERKSVKTISIGYGHLFFTHKTNIGNGTLEGIISTLGLSIGLKGIEHFYKIPTIDAGLGYYVSGNTILGFSSSSYAKKSDSSQTATVNGVTISNVAVLSSEKKDFVKNVSQNINFGINFYTKAPILTTNIGIGPSVNFLFYNFSTKKPQFTNAIGVGASLDIEFHFSITQLVNIPLSIHTAYYPLNFNSSNNAFKYEIQSMFLVAIQLGVAFRY